MVHPQPPKHSLSRPHPVRSDLHRVALRVPIAMARQVWLLLRLRLPLRRLHHPHPHHCRSDHCYNLHLPLQRELSLVVAQLLRGRGKRHLGVFVLHLVLFHEITCNGLRE